MRSKRIRHNITRQHITAVAAGFVVWTVLWLTINRLFKVGFPHWYGVDGRALGLTPLFSNLIVTALISLCAGYLTVRIANAARAAFILSILQISVGLAVTVQFLDVAPLWYHSTFLILLMPTHLLGGYLAQRQIDSASSTQL